VKKLLIVDVWQGFPEDLLGHFVWGKDRVKVPKGKDSIGHTLPAPQWTPAPIIDKTRFLRKKFNAYDCAWKSRTQRHT
jgi:hypothetical protein